MSLAAFRKVYGKNGSGRFVVSEGVAPSTYLLPHPGLPTLYTDIEDDRFEIVMTKGTILSVVADSNGDSRTVPANGTGTAIAWDDNELVNLDTFPPATPTTVAGGTDSVTVPARSTVIGCAQYDLYRPFDKGTSQGSGWITHGYVEWPLVQGVNGTLAVGDLIRSDHMGRPVKCGKTAADDANANASDHPWIVVGKVIEIETYASNFDDGLLSYMQLPSDPGALKKVYELTKTGPYSGKLGIRSNLDVQNSIGAVRVLLTV